VVGTQHPPAGIGQMPVVGLGRLTEAIDHGGQATLDRQRCCVFRSSRGHDDRVRATQLVAGLGQVAKPAGDRGEVDHEGGQPRILATQSQLPGGESVFDQGPGAGEVPGLRELPRVRVGIDDVIQFFLWMRLVLP
jgi:hypothetical protein